MLLLVPTSVGAQTGGTSFQSESEPPTAEKPAPQMSGPGKWTGPEVPGTKAKLLRTGLAAAPADAPEQVKQAIWAANSLQKLPYLYGGGHTPDFDVSKGADCSSTVSFALNGGELIDAPMASGPLMKWGESGRGEWITVFTKPSHAYVVIAGLRLDTSVGPRPRGRRVPPSTLQDGPRWRGPTRDTQGYVKRHPLGL